MAGLAGVEAVVSAARWPKALALRGPGDLRTADLTGVLIFDAAAADRQLDLIARFYAEDVGKLDWLEDYVFDARAIGLLRELIDPIEDDEEEEVWARDLAIGIETDPGWAS
ncbi:MAG TPA: hypothetical protein VMB71_11875 [Acetobacteraceae bacterium]|nr:hypothetical protein [Acetobacteraceae bacterium]